MIITVTLKAALDRIITVPALNLGDVTRSEGTFDYPGGKGINVSRALIRLGYGATTATGFLGGSVGQIVADYLAEEGIRSAFVHTASPSAIDIQLDETEAGRVSAIYERGPDVTPEEIDALRRQFDGLVKEAELCVFAGRAPCPALNTLFAEFINQCREHNVRALLDTNGPALRPAVAAQPFMLRINQHELSELLGRRLLNRTEQAAAMRDLAWGGIDWVVVSLGAEGALVATQGDVWYAKAPKVTGRYTVGCGDAMLAGLALGLVQGLSTEDTIRLGMTAAAANVLVPGSGFLNRYDVDAIIDQCKLEPFDAFVKNEA